MISTPVQKYKQTEKEIPIWKQNIILIDNQIMNYDLRMKDFISKAYELSLEIEKLKDQKTKILSNKKERSLWKQ
jgi:hypothetical protein